MRNRLKLTKKNFPGVVRLLKKLHLTVGSFGGQDIFGSAKLPRLSLGSFTKVFLHGAKAFGSSSGRGA